MTTLMSEMLSGRKTFFIVPDQSLFPSNYLEEFLVDGYETYFIENDKICPLERKVEIIMDIFKDCIIFFNIDANIANIHWPTYIKNLQNRCNPTTVLGVFYVKRSSVQERFALEKLYLYDIGIQSGCVQLEYRKNANFTIIEKILYANQAMGRRKFVRAICENSCSLSFVFNGVQYDGVISDISLSHFSCSFRVHCPVPQYEKVQNIQFNIRGMHFRSDAVLFMQRMSENGMLFIFAFTNKQGGNGLDLYAQQMLIPKLYDIMNDNCKGILDPLFHNLNHNKDSSIGSIARQQAQRDAEALFSELIGQQINHA